MAEVWLLQEEEFEDQGSHWVTLGVYPDRAAVQIAAEETVAGRDPRLWDRATLRGVPAELGGAVDEDRAAMLWEDEPPEREPSPRRLELGSADVTQAMAADLVIRALLERAEGPMPGAGAVLRIRDVRDG